MDIRGQDQAYKRGLVLGLTMAEIVILVLFCLLLALAAVFAVHRERIKLQTERIAALEKAVQVDPEDLRLVAILKSYWENHAPKDVEFRGYFSQLVLQVEELEKLRAQLETLVEKNRDQEEQAKNTKALQNLWQQQGIDVNTPQGRERLKEIAGGPGEHDWPPIIMLSEADKYSFQVGSAALSDSFRRLLSDEVVPKLLELIGKYKVNVVEVVGHTDEQSYKTTTPSNLDTDLPRVFKDGMPVAELTPADNAGLGLARAVSVARALAADKRLAGIIVLPLSGGQLIDDDRMTSWAGGDVPARRRIEIRVRRPSVRVDTTLTGSN
jgi:flagellar motor protein MotB